MQTTEITLEEQIQETKISYVKSLLVDDETHVELKDQLAKLEEEKSLADGMDLFDFDLF